MRGTGTIITIMTMRMIIIMGIMATIIMITRTRLTMTIGTATITRMTT